MTGVMVMTLKHEFEWNPVITFLSFYPKMLVFVFHLNLVGIVARSHLRCKTSLTWFILVSAVLL